MVKVSFVNWYIILKQISNAYPNSIKLILIIIEINFLHLIRIIIDTNLFILI